MTRAAKRAGADCKKLLTFTPDTITINSNKDDFKIKGAIWLGKNYYQLNGEAFPPLEWHKKLFEAAKEEGLVYFFHHLIRAMKLKLRLTTYQNFYLILFLSEDELQNRKNQNRSRFSSIHYS